MLALLDVLLCSAALIVEGDAALGGAQEIGHDEADAGTKLTRVPFHLGDDPTGLLPAGGLMAEAGVIPAHVLRWPSDGALEQMRVAVL